MHRRDRRALAPTPAARAFARASPPTREGARLDPEARPQARNVVRLAFAAKVAQVVANLIRDAERFAVIRQRVRDFLMLFNSGVERAESKRHFKCRSRFLAENVEHLGLCQRPWRARPAKFRALSATKLSLPLRRDQEHFCFLLRRRPARADEAIPFADEQIANVQRNGNAMLFVQRLFAVAHGVVVLDVIVDQRRFVKTFHRQRHFTNVLRQRRARGFAQGLVRRHGQERTPPFAGARQPFACDLFRFALNRAHDFFERVAGEPGIHFVAHRSEVEPARFVVAGKMDVFPDPVQVHRRVNAVVLQQRDGHAGYRRGFHVRKCALQNAQAAHADDGLNLPRLNEAHDDGAAFCNEHSVAELFRFGLQILDRAQTALLAEQTELIERRRAFALDAQAFRQQQQPAFVRNGGERLPPHFVVDQHADVIAVKRVAVQHLNYQFRVNFEFFDGQRRNRTVLRDIIPHHLQDVVSLDRRLRDVLLWRTKALLDDVTRNDERGSLHNQFVQRSIKRIMAQRLRLERQYSLSQAPERALISIHAPSTQRRAGRFDTRRNR